MSDEIICINENCPFNNQCVSDGCVLSPDDIQDYFGDKCPEYIKGDR